MLTPIPNPWKCQYERQLRGGGGVGGTLWTAYANDSANNDMRHCKCSGLNNRANYDKNIAHQYAAASTKRHADEEDQC